MHIIVSKRSNSDELLLNLVLAGHQTTHKTCQLQVGYDNELSLLCAIYTADADATQLGSCVGSASVVCIGH